MAPEKAGRYNIRVLGRAMRVLDALSESQPSSLTELSRALNMSTSTTFRILASLASHGCVEKDGPFGKYRLGLRVIELARAYFEGNDLRRSALPELERLRDTTGETVHLGVLNEMEVVYLEKLHGHHAIGLMSSRVGGRSPAYCTGLGKVLLAHSDPERIRKHFEGVGLTRFTDATVRTVPALMEVLDRVRKVGYAIDQGEHEAEVRCVAAPVFDLSDQVVAAISVSGPAGRMNPIEDNARLIERTRAAAQEISRRLGFNRVGSLEGVRG